MPSVSNGQSASPLPTAASDARVQSPYPAQCQNPSETTTFASASPTDRNLVLGRMNGSATTVVRDITDIAHPSTIGTPLLDLSPAGRLDPWGPWRPMFIGGSEIGDGTDGHLGLVSIVGGQRVTVYSAQCRSGIVTYAWNNGGDYLSYVIEVPENISSRFEWHLVGHGTDRVLGYAPAWCHCGGTGPADNYSLYAKFSPDGKYVSWVEDGVAVGGSDLQVRRLDGTLVGSESTGSMSVWSGGDLYFRDGNGVERWRAGAVTLVLRTAAWIRPQASPGGGQIAYWARAQDGLGRVFVLDTSTGTSRQISTEPRMEPVFLSSRYIWYVGERTCLPTDVCALAQTITTGVSYVYDLQDGTESTSAIAAVYDVWPHGQ
jgi:hypothetical protein